jgi:valyl-tRNA synthetase
MDKTWFEQPIQSTLYEKNLEFFAELMQLLHPYMPFITEEIYHSLEERS